MKNMIPEVNFATRVFYALNRLRQTEDKSPTRREICDYIRLNFNAKGDLSKRVESTLKQALKEGKCELRNGRFRLLVPFSQLQRNACGSGNKGAKKGQKRPSRKGARRKVQQKGNSISESTRNRMLSLLDRIRAALGCGDKSAECRKKKRSNRKKSAKKDKCNCKAKAAKPKRSNSKVRRSKSPCRKSKPRSKPLVKPPEQEPCAKKNERPKRAKKRKSIEANNEEPEPSQSEDTASSSKDLGNDEEMKNMSEPEDKCNDLPEDAESIFFPSYTN